MVTTIAPSVSWGFFPLDEALALRKACLWSPRLLRLLLQLTARLPYAEAVALLKELAGIRVSVSSGWRVTQEWGVALQRELQQEEVREKAAARAWSTPGGRPPPRQRLGAALDGAMIHIRKESYKEFKVGCLYAVELETRRDPATGDRGEFGHAVRLSYVAHLGGPEAFGWQLWTEAHRRGWQQATETQVVGDGAAWIWNLQQEHFPDSLPVVDWYHAVEHLGAAKLLLYPEEGPQASQWYNRYEQALYQGHAEEVARSLEAAAKTRDAAQSEALRKAAGYFKHNRERMRYQEVREEGWPIGSGAVESGAKQFKARVCGPGMRWSRPGAEHMLTLRAVVLTGNQRFDALWSRVYSNPPPT